MLDITNEAEGRFFCLILYADPCETPEIAEKPLCFLRVLPVYPRVNLSYPRVFCATESIFRLSESKSAVSESIPGALKIKFFLLLILIISPKNDDTNQRIEEISSFQKEMIPK